MVEEVIVRARGLSCKSGYSYLLRDVNWEVKQGEHWVVFGLNGSGKTTLLSMIAGFKEPTHGQLEVLGQSYGKDNLFALRRQIGWVSSSFFDKQLNRENVLDIVLSGLFGTLGLRSGVQIEDVLKAKALLRELHLGDKIMYPFDLLSKGERQNVMIARALISNPRILVLDEPSTGLDVLAREHMLGTVEQLAQQTTMTMIYVTHYVEEILPVFQHSLLLKRGRIVAKGKTEALFCSERMSALLDFPVTISQDQRQRYQLETEVPSAICQILMERSERDGGITG